MSQKDLRVRRTNKYLRQAFLELLAEKGFEAMTVQEIAERAMVNRSTFYRHYQDKYDLAICIVEDMFDELLEEAPPPPSGPEAVSLERPLEVWAKLLACLQEHALLYQLVLTHRGGADFQKHLQTFVEGLVRQRLSALWKASKQPRMPFDVIVGYSMSAFLGMLVWWLEQGTPYTPEQMALWLQQLLVLGPYYAVGLDLPIASRDEFSP